MLASTEVILTVADILKRTSIPCVVDPVCSCASELIEGDGVYLRFDIITAGGNESISNTSFTLYHFIDSESSRSVTSC